MDTYVNILELNDEYKYVDERMLPMGLRRIKPSLDVEMMKSQKSVVHRCSKVTFS